LLTLRGFIFLRGSREIAAGGAGAVCKVDFRSETPR
jgi:hypothetical protein